MKTGEPTEPSLISSQKPYDLVIDIFSSVGLKRGDTRFKVDPREEGGLTGPYNDGLGEALTGIMKNLGDTPWSALSTSSEIASAGIDSDIETTLGVSANVAQSSTSFSRMLKVDSQSDKRLYFVLFKQVYFSVKRETPSPSDLYDFRTSSFYKKYTRQYNESKPINVINQIDYGRMILIRAEYDKSVTESEAQAHLRQSMVSFESAAKSSSSDDDEKKSSDSESDDADKANKDSCKNPTDEFLDICASFHYKHLSEKLTLKYTLLGGVSRSVSDLSASVECQDELCDIKFESLKRILDEGSLFTKGVGFVPVGYSTIFPDGSKGIIYLTGQKVVEQCSSSA